MLTNFAKGSVFDGTRIASLNAIVSNLIKKLATKVVLKNGSFHIVKYGRYQGIKTRIQTFLDFFFRDYFKIFLSNFLELCL